MAESTELNSELQATVNKRFDGLLKEIGPNRAQLSTKVSMAFREIHKELNKSKVDAKRAGAILMEIKNIERMAAKQLPHHLMPPKPASAVSDKAVIAKAEKKPAAVKEKKPAPAAKAPEKKSPEKKTPPKKAVAKKKK